MYSKFCNLSFHMGRLWTCFENRSDLYICKHLGRLLKSIIEFCPLIFSVYSYR